MMHLISFTRLRRERGRKKALHICCLVYLHESRGGMARNRVANAVIWSRKKCFACLSVELQQIERALKHDANNLDVLMIRGYILIFHGLISSYCITLLKGHIFLLQKYMFFLLDVLIYSDLFHKTSWNLIGMQQFSI